MSKSGTPPTSHATRVGQKHLQVRFKTDTGASDVSIIPPLTAEAHKAGQEALEAETQKRHKGLHVQDRKNLAEDLTTYTQVLGEIASLEELRQRVRELIVHAFIPRNTPKNDFRSSCVSHYYDAVCQNLGVEHPLNQQPSVHR